MTTPASFHRLLADTAARVLEERCTPEALERAELGGFAESLWQGLVEAELPQALVPEERGGAGLGLGDAAALVHAVGRYSAPVPLAETMLAGWLAGRCGITLPAGNAAAVVPAEAGEIVLEGAAGSARLRGAATAVPWGDRSALAVVATTGATAVLALVAPGSARAARRRNLAAEPRAALDLSSGRVLAHAPLDLSWLEARGAPALFRSALMAGAAQQVLALAIEHARGRVQFGRPIGSFQAVQQMLADLAAEVAATTAAVQAAAGASETRPALVAIAAAKTTAGVAARRIAKIAHQVHGAIGFTHEHALHRSTRRLLAWRDEDGDERWWAEWLGGHACAAGAGRLFDLLS